MTVLTFDKNQMKHLKNLVSTKVGKSSIGFMDTVKFEVTNYGVLRVSVITNEMNLIESDITPIGIDNVNVTTIQVPHEAIKGVKLERSEKSEYTFTFDSSESLHVKTPNGQSKCSLVENDYPKAPASVGKYKTVMSIRPSTLSNLIAASKSVATTEARPILTTVCVRDNVIISTDSHRLYRSESASQIEGGETIIPSDLLNYISKVEDTKSVFGVLKVRDEEYCNDLLFETLTTRYFVKGVDGNYPATERLVPTDFNLEFTVDDIKAFKEGLLSAEKVAKRDRNCATRLNYSDNQVTLSVRVTDDTGTYEFEEVYDVSSTLGGDDDFKICFNAKFLIDGMNQLNNYDGMLFRFRGPMHPFVIEGLNNSLALVLPVRTY